MSIGRVSAATRPTLRQLVRYGLRGRDVRPPFSHDFRRYAPRCSIVALDRDEALLGRSAAEYHSIEKGLSLPEPRLGFGKRALRLRIDVIRRAYRPARGGATMDGARDTLACHRHFHRKRDHFAHRQRDRVERILGNIGGAGGTAVGRPRPITCDEIARATSMLLGLYSFQLSEITIDWSNSASTGLKLGCLLILTESQVLILIIGVGQLCIISVLPVFPRKPLVDLLHVHNAPCL